MIALLVEDHPVVRAGCRRVLAQRPDLEILESANASEAWGVVTRYKIAVLFLDLHLPDAKGLELLKSLQEHDPDMRIVVFTMYEEPSFVDLAVEAGAIAYVSKNDDPDCLLEAFDKSLKGELFFSPAVAHRVAVASLTPAPTFSERERKLLTLLTEGLTLNEIAASLGVSYRTCADMAVRIRLRCGLRSNADLVRMAVKQAMTRAPAAP